MSVCLNLTEPLNELTMVLTRDCGSLSPVPPPPLYVHNIVGQQVHFPFSSSKRSVQIIDT